jgi:hypothetical protein
MNQPAARATRGRDELLEGGLDFRDHTRHVAGGLGTTRAKSVTRANVKRWVGRVVGLSFDSYLL